MDDQLQNLIHMLKTYEPLFHSLTKEEQVGYVFSMRWSRLSEISGRYSNEEILKKIREHFDGI